MKRFTIAVVAAIVLAAPALAGADEWERISPGGYSEGYSQGGGAEAPAPAAPVYAAPMAESDVQVLNHALESVRSTQPGNDPCGMVGLLAAVAATSRDQGQTKAEQVQDSICSFSRLTSGTRSTLQWSNSFSALLDREIAFVYRHPEMTGAQVMSYWSRLCESPFGMVTPQAPQPVETLPTP